MRHRILYVGICPKHVTPLESGLRPPCELVTAATAESALLTAHLQGPEVILLDRSSPGADEIAELLQGSDQTRPIPILALQPPHPPNARIRPDAFAGILPLPLKKARLEQALSRLLSRPLLHPNTV